jgi:uncharacterized protein (DUF924 family)
MKYNFTSTFPKVSLRTHNLDASLTCLTPLKLLSFQYAFKPNISFMRTMSTSPLPNADATRIVDYWFSEPPGAPCTQKWFSGGSKVDTEIRNQFSSFVTQARASQLDSWKEKPTSTLALIILLDQFPRNIFRGTADSFASDSMALEVTTEAIEKGFDTQVPELQQSFFYLPLMHSENLEVQEKNMVLLERYRDRCDSESEEGKMVVRSWEFAESHRDIIRRFGRFPSRNEILGRKSTDEEIEFLKKHPGGF